MSRLTELKQRIDELYQAKNDGRADWADWLYTHHVFVVADYAGELADRFHANKELAIAAAMLHDIADAVMSRFDPKHEEESFVIARRLLREVGFNDEEIRLIVDDAIKLHSCFDGIAPSSLEGQVMATADALVHLKTDFYTFGLEDMRKQKTNEQIKAWALKKIDRDYHDKIRFDEVKEEVSSEYERLKTFFTELK